MKKRWKFTITLLTLAGLAFLSLTHFLVSNNAPILSGEVIRNIEYKKGLKLDVYLPTAKVFEKTPVVVYIHGGAWITGIKETLNFNRFNLTANQLRQSGYAIVSINYTLAQSGRSPFPACVEDASDAVSWIRQNATTYDFDRGNIGLFGESAGAHIAMMVAYSDSPNSENHFRYVVDIYGPSLLKEIYRTPFLNNVYATIQKFPDAWQDKMDPAKYVLGFDPKQDTAKAELMMDAYSPYNELTSNAPPTLLIQGDSDRVVPLEQSILLKVKLDSLGVENEIHVVKGADHAFAKATAGQKAQLQQWVVEFIRRHHLDESNGF